MGLTLEQQFKLTVLKEEISRLDPEQAKELLLEVMRQNMVKDNLLKQWIKQ